MSVRVIHSGVLTRPPDGQEATVEVHIVAGDACPQSVRLLSFVASGFGRTVHFYRPFNRKARMECPDGCYAHVNVWLFEGIDPRTESEEDADYRWRYQSLGFLPFASWSDLLCYYLTGDLEYHAAMVDAQEVN